MVSRRQIGWTLAQATRTASGVLAMVALGFANPGCAQAEAATRLAIPALHLGDAIREVANQSGIQIVFYSEDTDGLTAPAIEGVYTPERALDLILTGTELQYQRVNPRTIAVTALASVDDPGQDETSEQESGDATSGGSSRPQDPQGAARSSDEGGLRVEEVVVTARKRNETVQDVPGVITVLGAEALRSNGTTDAQSLALNNLGVVYSVTFAGSSAPRITIRGVGDDDFNPNGSSSAAVHVNGIYQGSNGLLNAQYFDVDQVEVLKGPQGTLYGRNATAGAINLLTRRPEDTFGGYLDVDFGNFGLARGEGAVSAPLSDSVSLRFAGLLEQSDGFFEHLGTGPVSGFSYTPGTIPAQDSVAAQGDWGAIDRAFGRVTAEVDVSDATVLTLRTNFGSDKSELPLPDVTPELWAAYEERAFFINPADPAFTAFESALDSDPFTVFANALPQLDADHFGANVKLDHEFTQYLNATLLLGYESLDRHYDTTDNLPIQAADYNWDNEFEQFSAEARISGATQGNVEWILGAFYLEDEVDFGTTLFFRNTGLWQTDIQTDYMQERRSIGFFASADWNINEWLTFEGGVRYSSDEVDFSGQTTNLDPFGTFGPPPTFFPLGDVYIGAPIDPNAPLIFDENLDDDDVTWKASVIARPTDVLSVYATASTGYKAGASMVPRSCHRRKRCRSRRKR